MAESVSTETRSDDGSIPPPRRKLPIFTIVALAIVAFLVGGIGGSFQAKLTEVQKNDNASFLSRTAESTLVADETERFVPVQSLPGSVVFHRDSGLTDADRAAVESARTAIAVAFSPE